MDNLGIPTYKILKIIAATKAPYFGFYERPFKRIITSNILFQIMFLRYIILISYCLPPNTNRFFSPPPLSLSLSLSLSPLLVSSHVPLSKKCLCMVLLVVCDRLHEKPMSQEQIQLNVHFVYNTQIIREDDIGVKKKE